MHRSAIGATLPILFGAAASDLLPAAESYQRGFADIVSLGRASQSDEFSRRTELREARTLDIQNRVKWTESYYQMRNANREYRASKRTPRLSDEEIVRISRVGLPNRLTTADLDPLTGQLNWPIVLREPAYANERAELDKLFSDRSIASSVSPDLYNAIQKNTKDLLELLRKNINQYKANDWLNAKKFVESLAYETRFPAG